MRILHLIQRYWPARGGAEIHMAEISARFAAEGHDVTIVTTDALDFEYFWDPQCRRIAETESSRDGVRILRFPVRHLPVPSLSYPAWRRLLWLTSAVPVIPVAVLHRMARLTPWVPKLWHWLDTTDERFDIVAGMTICFEPLLEAGLRFARRRNIPYISIPLTHMGAGRQPATDALSRFYTMRHQVALSRESDAVAAQTPAERQFFVQRGVPEQRVMVAGSGVTPAEVVGGNGERFRQRYGISGPLVVSLSSMSYDKGTVHVVEAIRHLWQTGRQVDLVLAGSVLSPFQRWLDTLPIGDRQRIHLLGPIDDEEKRDMLAAADLFAMPSRTDSFGIVYLEAWLYRKPVIAAQSWGVSDVVEDGLDGLLVPFGDVTALCSAIEYLLDHPSERASMGAWGEQKVYECHTWDRKYALVRDLYQGLLAERR